MMVMIMRRAQRRNNRVRVVRIIDRLNIGGPAKHVTWLSAGLDPEAFETVLITGVVPPGEGDMSYFARAAGVSPVIIKEMSREPGLRDVLVIAKLLGHLWRLKPEIVHTHKAKAGAAGRIAATLYRWMTPSALRLRPRPCRIVHTFHGHIFHSYYGAARSRLFIAIERALARLTDRIVTISEQQRREINEGFHVGRAGQFEVIPLGIDFDEFRGRGGHLRKELGLDDGVVLIGIVGRLCEVKNHSMMIEAMARLAKSAGSTGYRLVIIGDGHLRPELEALAARLGISDLVAFTGFREDAPSLYADLDIVALTSLNEGTPLTLIEAMSCARAVVTTEVGGVVDIMGERRERVEGYTIWDHGITAPSRDVEAFARALQFMTEHAGARREMGERGRQFVQSRLSRERLLRDTERLYRDLGWA
jgi:glycosyltransferase involved in cell wall biosynthesis